MVLNRPPSERFAHNSKCTLHIHLVKTFYVSIKSTLALLNSSLAIELGRKRYLERPVEKFKERIPKFWIQAPVVEWLNSGILKRLELEERSDCWELWGWRRGFDDKDEGFNTELLLDQEPVLMSELSGWRQARAGCQFGCGAAEIWMRWSLQRVEDGRLTRNCHA